MTDEQWGVVDRHLSQSEVFVATMFYLKVCGCGIAEAKNAIGTRFREHYPQLWSGYKDLSEDD